MKNKIKKIAERLGLLHLTKFWSRKQLKIFMYHRIISHRYIGGLSAEVFEQQMIYLKNNFVLLSVNEIIENQKSGKIIPNSVAITFDDGHKDFYDTAWPILKKHKIPATLYVTTGFVDGTLWLWPDLLKYMLMHSIGKTVNFGSSAYTLTEDNVNSVWNSIADQLLVIPTAERIYFLRNFAKEQGLEIDAGPIAPFNAVTWDNLREMRSEGLDVGSHSVTHPILSDLTGAALNFELEESKKRIESELGLLPRGMCYPNGTARDINAEVEAATAELYQYAVVAYPCGFDKNLMMRIGRFSGSSGFEYFRRLVNGAVFKANKVGRT